MAGTSSGCAPQRPQPPAGAGTGDSAPVVLVIEDHGGLSRQYRHVFDYLGVRLNRIRTVSDLVRALHAGAPLALIWDLEAAFDREQVGLALADAGRDLPLLIIGEDEAEAARAAMSGCNGSAPTQLVAAPSLRDLAEFLFRAGRHTGQLRVLAV